MTEEKTSKMDSITLRLKLLSGLILFLFYLVAFMWKTKINIEYLAERVGYAVLLWERDKRLLWKATNKPEILSPAADLQGGFLE